MDFTKLLLEPAILIITGVFLVFAINTLRNYSIIEKNLNSVYVFLQNIAKNEISYRFNQINEFMLENRFTTTCWEDFRKALIFPEKLYTASQVSKKTGEQVPEIYLTLDSSFFFNEDSLVHSKINYKFIQSMPTLLTGLGPFFTFLKMAIAFAVVDLTSDVASSSFNGLISNIHIAALCSVFAVGYSLIFLLVEKVLYNKKCKKYVHLIQKEFIRLFDVCTSEQFLIDLLKESKQQGLNNEKILKSLPEDFAQKISKSLGEMTTPYLENILYSLNKINESIDKGGSNNDVVDKLF